LAASEWRVSPILWSDYTNHHASDNDNDGADKNSNENNDYGDDHENNKE